MVQRTIGPQATTMCIRNIGRISGELFTGRGPKTSIIGTTLITRIQLIQIRLAWRHRGLGNIDRGGKNDTELHDGADVSFAGEPVAVVVSLL